jgi:hypothetical protein
LEHCSIFISGVSRKNNWDEIVGVFIQEKVWLKNILSQSEEEDRGGDCRSSKTGCGGQRPQMEACRKYVREERPYVRVWERGRGMVEVELLCCRWLSPFFKHL